MSLVLGRLDRLVCLFVVHLICITTISSISITIMLSFFLFRCLIDIKQKVRSLKADLKKHIILVGVFTSLILSSLVRLSFDRKEKRRFYGFLKLVSFGQGSNFSKKRKDNNMIIWCFRITFGQGLSGHSFLQF